MWNALGGITWAITIGIVGYIVGTAAEQIVEKAGLGAAILVGVLVIAALVYFHVRRGRHRRTPPPAEPEPEPLGRGTRD